MVTKKQKSRMLEYLVENIRLGGHKAEPFTGNIVEGVKDSNYIKVDDHGLVLLVDKKYPAIKRKGNSSIPRLRLIEEASRANKRHDMAFVFYKDGQTYFRNAAEDKTWKTNDLSLKLYQPGGCYYSKVEGMTPMQRMIDLRPEEKFVLSRTKDILQYFQPQSPQLDEKLATFRFEPVEYDYTHETKTGFQPPNQYSQNLKMWEKRFGNNGALTLQNGLLRKPKE